MNDLTSERKCIICNSPRNELTHFIPNEAFPSFLNANSKLNGKISKCLPRELSLCRNCERNYRCYELFHSVLDDATPREVLHLSSMEKMSSKSLHKLKRKFGLSARKDSKETMIRSIVTTLCAREWCKGIFIKWIYKMRQRYIHRRRRKQTNGEVILSFGPEIEGQLEMPAEKKRKLSTGTSICNKVDRNRIISSEKSESHRSHLHLQNVNSSEKFLRETDEEHASSTDVSIKFERLKKEERMKKYPLFARKSSRNTISHRIMKRKTVQISVECDENTSTNEDSFSDDLSDDPFF